MGRKRTYSDNALREAVATSRSWRGVLRGLGLLSTSSSAMRSVRRRADELGIDYGHLTRRRPWADTEFSDAVRRAHSWSDVATSLGVDDASRRSTLKGHAARLGLDVAHLCLPDNSESASGHELRHQLTPGRVHLARAGSTIAAAWFTLCGAEVSWPLEPCRYDLLVRFGGAVHRVQVKTATVRAGKSWTVWLSTTGRRRKAYDPDEIDYFLVLDGDLALYLIPVAAVGGFQAINLGAYERYRLARPAITPFGSGHGGGPDNDAVA